MLRLEVRYLGVFDDDGAPRLTALMCDGLGSFTSLGFKRALLVFDEIAYLLPADTVAFRDTDGEERWLMFPPELERSRLFRAVRPSHTPAVAGAILASARADSTDGDFRAKVAAIPAADRLYTWRVASSDRDFGPLLRDVSQRDAEVMAHALLINRFLFGADESDHIPISGRSETRALLSSKIATASDTGLLRRTTTSKLQPISLALVENFISDDDLADMPDEAVLEYKHANESLFRTFVSELLQITTAIKELPADDDFGEALNELRMGELWRRRENVIAELKDAWTAFFKTALKGTAAALLGLGVVPGVPLSALAVSAASASAVWALPDLVELLSRQRKLRRHGMYYLMNFA